MKNSFTLATIYLVAFAGFTSFSWLFPVMPYYAADLGIRASDIGLVVSIYSYVNAIGILPSGILSDRWGRKTFLIAGLIISTIAPFLYTFASDFGTLCMVRALHGMGSAFFIPAALAVVIDITERGDQGRVIGCGVNPYDWTEMVRRL